MVQLRLKTQLGFEVTSCGKFGNDFRVNSDKPKIRRFFVSIEKIEKPGSKMSL
jgi:hypothetical protein